MADRLTHRTTNVYGKDVAERTEALAYKESVELLLRGGATLEVDTRATLAEVVAGILDHAGLA